VVSDTSEADFRELVEVLKRHGYTVTKDPMIERNYSSLSKGHRRIFRSTPSGLFECDAEVYPIGLTFECYQNVRIENPNGGKYDFNKLEKMPFLIRMRFLHFRNAVDEYLAKRGLEFEPKLNIGASPLECFNDGWKSDRFSRGEDGWPDASELKSWKQVTKDGVAITQGMQVYCMSYRKRWICGRIFGGINGMWLMYDSNNRLLENHNGSHYYADLSVVTQGRVKDQHRDNRVFKEKWDEAFKSNDFKAISRLAPVASRLLTVG